MKPKYYLFRIQSPEHSTAIQERLFRLGVEWWAGKTTVQTTEMPTLLVEISSNKITYDQKSNTHLEGRFVTLTLNDLYSPDCPLLKPDHVEVKLSASHTAKVYKDKIVVGCQTFHLGIIPALSQAHDKVCAS